MKLLTLGSKKCKQCNQINRYQTNTARLSTRRRRNHARRRRRTRIASTRAPAAPTAPTTGFTGVYIDVVRQRYASRADALLRRSRRAGDDDDGSAVRRCVVDDALRRSRRAVGDDVRDRCEWDDGDDGVGSRSCAKRERERFGGGPDAWERCETTARWWWRGCRRRW